MPTHNRFDSSFNNENNNGIKAQDTNRHSRHSDYRDNCKGVKEEEEGEETVGIIHVKEKLTGLP
jgi:hypothetical protein